MSPAPTNLSDKGGVSDYRNAWRAVMKLAREGKSWSGNERNCIFLNCPDTQPHSQVPAFANISAISGLDHIGDGRALAVTDWDGDGDLDLWFRDRTAPRLRIMVNRSVEQDAATAKNCVIKLEGNDSNRDAIGARVTLTFDDGTKSARTLRAGDAFLSQSSKWLHFGCGEKQISHVDVSWPGGDIENFKGLKTGDRAKLRQGTGSAETVAGRNQSQMAFNKKGAIKPPAPSDQAPDPGAAQILLPARIPLPKFTFQNSFGELPTELGASPAPKLLFFWSAGCPNCAEQIGRFAEQRAPAGLHLINIDAAAATPESADPFATAREKLSLLGARNVPLSFAPPETLGRLAHFQRALFDNHIPFAVPFAILTDGNQNAVAIYRGNLSNDILETHIALANESNETLRSKAVPFPGRWFTNAITPAEMAAMTARLFLENYPADAAAMFERAMDLAETATAKKNFLATAFNIHHQIARQSATMKQPEKSRLHYRQAIDLNPQHAEIRCDYGALLANHQQFAEAEAQFRKALELRPNYPLAQKNLELLIKIQAK